MRNKGQLSKQYKDEMIRRQVQVARYATGQANYANALINELNEKIALFCIKKDYIETKSQYAECKEYIRAKSMECREKLYKRLQKELRDFIIEQSKWVYGNSPVKLEKTNVDKIARNIFFTAYSDTDNIKSYITRTFNQIFQIWNAQLTIAYRTGQNMRNMVKLVLDREFK